MSFFDSFSHNIKGKIRSIREKNSLHFTCLVPDVKIDEKEAVAYEQKKAKKAAATWIGRW